MNFFEEIKTLLRERSGRRLVAFSVAVFLLITVIVFFAVFRLCRNIHLKQMDEGLAEIPGIIDNVRDELLMRSRVYEEDILARAEFGRKLYEEEDTLANAERLEQMRIAASAVSVSLLNGQRELVSSTGPGSPEEIFLPCVRDLEPLLPHLEFYPARSKEGEETGKSDGKGFVLLPIPGNTTSSLLFEFSCDTMLELYNALDDGSSVLERIYARGGGFAFAKSGDKLAGYPLDSLTDEQTSQLFEELTEVFRGGKFRSTGGGRPSKFITLLGRRYLAVLMHYSQDGQEDIDFLMTVPLKNVIGNGFYIAASISAIICWGIVLIQLYIYRRLAQKKVLNEEEDVSRKWVCRVTWPGIVMVLVITVVFSCMLLLLESRTNTAIITMTKRMDVQQTIDWHRGQEGTIRRSFVDFYRKRAQMLAAFLTERPDYRTHAGLEELSHIAGTDYLMLFDSNGEELVSSNSYKGFSVGANLSEAYRAVLLGYPDAVAGPEADPYTGRMQLGTAILMTDEEGQADGFLLAVYSAGELNAELERMSYENVVNRFTVREGYIAAAVSNEDGCFIAHTDPNMIGRKAADYLTDYTPGSSFEGFADYNGVTMCISADAADGKTLLFMVPEKVDSYVHSASGPMALAVLLILTLVYYPTAGILIVRAMTEEEGKLQPKKRTRNPIMVFLDGYSFFLTLFAIFAMIAATNDWWNSFDYVFGGNWSRGVHLYSLWAALFILAATLWCEYLIRTVLALLESRLSLRAKTVTRLANSLIVYAANFTLVFGILSVFGVNTTALLASAGIVSIAVGMGAQSMAADLLAGFFMMLEGSVHVGDSVSVAGVTGRITDMGIRTTVITDENGGVVILNNSKVSPVRNMSRMSTPQELENSLEDEA